MYTSDAELLSYVYDLLEDMKKNNKFSEKTTFQDVAEYSDEMISLKEILVE